MTDLALLELAAKAAGFKGKWNASWYAMCDGENYWDPLRHNGQALRLAVKLGLDVFCRPAQWTECGRIGHEGAREKYTTDPMKSTRRAIVLTAAELGKAL